jgi:hypothetical protein
MSELRGLRLLVIGCHIILRGHGVSCWVSNRFADFENFDAEVKINSAWEMIRENIKILVWYLLCRNPH